MTKYFSLLTATLTILCQPHVTLAGFLTVYGGPTYSSSTGGYLAENPNSGFLYSAHVNDAGTAAATAHKFDSSGAYLQTRAFRWSAVSPVTELGGGQNSLRAESINSGGTVIGSAMALTEGYPGHRPPDRQNQPARWATSSTAATILDHPYTNADWSANFSFLSDLNDAGTAVGAVYKFVFDEYGVPVDLGTRPGRWGGSGTAVTELGLLRANPEGLQVGAAHAINAAGVAVGFSGKINPDGSNAGWSAVRWDASGTAATELGNLGTARNYGLYPDNWTESAAFAVNSAGMAVGYANVYDDGGQLLRQHAPVRWDPSGTATELGQLAVNADASVTWSPAALNDAGTAVGWVKKVRDDGILAGTRAVRWEASGAEAIELGNLGTSFGITYSEAMAINAAGTAVGFAGRYSATDAFLGERAVYWGDDTIAIDLNTLIDPSSGWVLNRALEISDTGWIVGFGTFDADGAGGQGAYFRHFLMQVPATAVPEPGSAVLLGLGAVNLAMRRRRPSTPSPSRRAPQWHRKALSTLTPADGVS